MAAAVTKMNSLIVFEMRRCSCSIIGKYDLGLQSKLASLFEAISRHERQDMVERAILELSPDEINRMLRVSEDGKRGKVIDSPYFSALHVAARSCNMFALNLLLERGADVHALDSRNETPLHNAAIRGNLVGVSLLLDHGAEVDPRSITGFTPLHHVAAAEYNSSRMMGLLLDRGADVNARDYRNRRTPLHYRAEKPSHDYTDAVTLLIRSGANVRLRDDEDKTPMAGVRSAGALTSFLGALPAAALDPSVLDDCADAMRNFLVKERKSGIDIIIRLIRRQKFMRKDSFLTKMMRIDPEYGPLFEKVFSTNLKERIAHFRTAVSTNAAKGPDGISYAASRCAVVRAAAVASAEATSEPSSSSG